MYSLSVMLQCVTYTMLAIDLGLHGSIGINSLLWVLFSQLPEEDYQSTIETLQIKILSTTVKSKIYRQRHIGNWNTLFTSMRGELSTMP